MEGVMTNQAGQPNAANTKDQVQFLPVQPLEILLAYDGSKHAQVAVDYLCDLELSPQSHITALAVMPTQRITGHEKLHADLERVQERLRTKGYQADFELKAGNPAATINAHALRDKVDLIVIGAQGLRSTLGILLGGVAQQVVEYSCCPVLVMRAPFHGLRRMLLATDGSDYSQQAIDYLTPRAGEEARCLPLVCNAELHVVHVLPPAISSEMAARTWVTGPEVMYPIPAPPMEIETMIKNEEQFGQRVLKDTVKQFIAGGIHPISEMLRGDAATEIIEYANRRKIDLIVCGSRGLNPVSGWLLGSVSRKLVHYSGCSVLLVKGETDVPH